MTIKEIIDQIDQIQKHIDGLDCIKFQIDVKTQVNWNEQEFIKRIGRSEKVKMVEHNVSLLLQDISIPQSETAVLYFVIDKYKELIKSLKSELHSEMKCPVST